MREKQFFRFVIYAIWLLCVRWFYVVWWARFDSLLLFSSLQWDCVMVYICFSTKWCTDCRSSGLGSYGFPCNLSLYNIDIYLVERLLALSAAAWQLLRNLFPFYFLLLALLFDTLFNHWLHTVTSVGSFCFLLSVLRNILPSSFLSLTTNIAALYFFGLILFWWIVFPFFLFLFLLFIISAGTTFPPFFYAIANLFTSSQSIPPRLAPVHWL